MAQKFKCHSSQQRAGLIEIEFPPSHPGAMEAFANAQGWDGGNSNIIYYKNMVNILIKKHILATLLFNILLKSAIMVQVVVSNLMMT